MSMKITKGKAGIGLKNRMKMDGIFYNGSTLNSNLKTKHIDNNRY